MKHKIFVDGQVGTTGLRIHERLAKRSDIEVLTIDEDKRKDPATRRELLNEADVVFLCLPDDAARESVSFVTNPKTTIIDASTAHRTHLDWTYGLPELNKGQRELIKRSRRIAVPGCFATALVLAVYPLIHEGVMARDYPVTCNAISGYSGGGSSLIRQYQDPNMREELKSPRFYSLALSHKHLPEMQKVSGLIYPPLFTPVVDNFYSGEVVAIPLIARLLGKKVTAKDIQEIFASYYEGQRFVKVMPFESEQYLDQGCFVATTCNETNRIELFVFGNDSRILILSRLDNLGKGSSGAAVQNMNIALGVDDGEGL